MAPTAEQTKRWRSARNAKKLSRLKNIEHSRHYKPREPENPVKHSLLRRMLDAGEITPAQHEAGLRFQADYYGHLDVRVAGYVPSNGGESCAFERLKRQAASYRRYADAFDALNGSVTLSARVATTGACHSNCRDPDLEHLRLGLSILCRHYNIPE